MPSRDNMGGDKSARLNYDGHKNYATISNYRKRGQRKGARDRLILSPLN